MTLAILLLAAAAAADPIASVSVRGRAVAGAREAGSELRAACYEKGGMEVLLAIGPFEKPQAADAFFPFAEFEGPDGKSAPMRVRLTPQPSGSGAAQKPVTALFRSSSGWFGVNQDFIFALYAANAWRLVNRAAAAKAAEVSIESGTHKLLLSYPEPAEALRRIATACR